MSAKQTVDEAIAGHKIVIFSKSYCPYCKRAKGLIASEFSHLKEQIYIKELDVSPDGPAIQEYLKEKTKQSTVPNIFINQKHIGGSDHLVKLQAEGKLADLVTASA